MKTVANIFLWITCFFMFVGFLFKFLHWPGGSIAVFLGTFTSLIAMLFYLVARYKNKAAVKTSTYYVYFYFFLMAFGAHFMIETNGTNAMPYVFMNDYKVESNKVLEKEIVLNKESANSNILFYCNIASEVINKIDSLKNEMIFKTGGIDSSNGIPIGLMDKEIGYYVLSQSNDLKENIKRLNYLGKEFVNKERLNLEMLDNVPNPKKPLAPSKTWITWESRISENVCLGAVLVILEDLKSRVLQNQLTILNSRNN